MPSVNFKNDTIEFPDTMSMEEIQDVLGGLYAAGQAVGEFGAMIGSGAFAEPVAGLTALATGDSDAVAGMMSRMTYQPKTEAGMKAMQRIGQDIQSLSNAAGLDNMSGYWRDRVVPALQESAGVVGGAALGAMGLAALVAISEMDGGSVGRSARRLGSAEVGAVGDLGRRKIRAYHGSPHDFPPVRELEMPDGAVVYQSMDDAIPEGARMIKEHPLGRFNMSKLGTGEGGQAYGHGLYFAESKDVASSYKDSFTRAFDEDLLTDKGRGVFSKLKNQKEIDRLEDFMSNNDEGWADTLFDEYGDDLDELLESEDLRGLSEKWKSQNPDKFEDWYRDQDPVEMDGIHEYMMSDDNQDLMIQGQSKLYEVTIDANPDELLDWDLPLSEQSEAVRNSLSGLKENYQWQDKFPIENVKGSALYAMNAGGDSAKAAENLRAKGIKGIRYKDGFSRGDPGGTSNYVIFDDRLISISKKYGITIPAAAAMMGVEGGYEEEI